MKLSDLHTLIALKRKAELVGLGVLIGALTLGSATALAVVPVAGTLPPATQVTINNGAGSQSDPHVSGDIATYTSDAANTGLLTQIRYYDFATGVDTGIPNGGNTDFGSDVSGSRIVFTRLSSGKETIMLFDASAGGSPTELDPVAGSQRVGAAIGGNTVAWVDVTASSAGEIVVHDLLTSSSQQLTFNTLIDRRAAVSPDGNVVVWQECISGNCDVLKAVKSASGWTVSGVATAGVSGILPPDTNGSIVVYAVNRTGNWDVHWTPVGGGAESSLELAGLETFPRVSENVIVFASSAPGATNNDLFVYDLATNTVYQVTNTPTLSEALNDVYVSPTRQVHLVWSVLEGFADENVYGLTFQLPAAAVAASAEFSPATLNLQSKGKWVNVLLEFPAGRNPRDVDLGTVTLQAIAPVVSAKIGIAPGSPAGIGDADGDGTADLLVRFDRATVQSWFSSDANAVFRVEGRFGDGTPFSGDASALVINAGAAHTDEENPGSVKP